MDVQYSIHAEGEERFLHLDVLLDDGSKIGQNLTTIFREGISAELTAEVVQVPLIDRAITVVEVDKVVFNDLLYNVSTIERLPLFSRQQLEVIAKVKILLDHHHHLTDREFLELKEDSKSLALPEEENRQFYLQLIALDSRFFDEIGEEFKTDPKFLHAVVCKQPLIYDRLNVEQKDLLFLPLERKEISFKEFFRLLRKQLLEHPEFAARLIHNLEHADEPLKEILSLDYFQSNQADFITGFLLAHPHILHHVSTEVIREFESKATFPILLLMILKKNVEIEERIIKDWSKEITMNPVIMKGLLSIEPKVIRFLDEEFLFDHPKLLYNLLDNKPDSFVYLNERFPPEKIVAILTQYPLLIDKIQSAIGGEFFERNAFHFYPMITDDPIKLQKFSPEWIIQNQEKIHEMILAQPTVLDKMTPVQRGAFFSSHPISIYIDQFFIPENFTVNLRSIPFCFNEEPTFLYRFHVKLQSIDDPIKILEHLDLRWKQTYEFVEWLFPIIGDEKSWKLIDFLHRTSFYYSVYDHISDSTIDKILWKYPAAIVRLPESKLTLERMNQIRDSIRDDPDRIKDSFIIEYYNGWKRSALDPHYQLQRDEELHSGEENLHFHLLSLATVSGIGGSFEEIALEGSHNWYYLREISKVTPLCGLDEEATRGIQNAFSQAGDLHFSEELAIDRYRSGEPIIINLGYSSEQGGHSVNMVLKGDKMIICNRGMRNVEYFPAIVYFEIDPTKVTVEILRLIDSFKMIAHSKGSDFCNYYVLPQILSKTGTEEEIALFLAKKAKIQEVLRTKNQTVGNCSCASAKAAFKAAAFLYSLDEMSPDLTSIQQIEVAGIFAKKAAKRMSVALREKMESKVATVERVRPIYLQSRCKTLKMRVKNLVESVEELREVMQKKEEEFVSDIESHVQALKTIPYRNLLVQLYLKAKKLGATVEQTQIAREIRLLLEHVRKEDLSPLEDLVTENSIHSEIGFV
jgi:hypothetical protein